MSTSSSLELRGVSRWYGDVVAVNDVTMTIGPGITGLLGPNGAGKTTLISMMAGLLSPSAGTVSLVRGPDERLRVRGDVSVYRHLGLVPEPETSYDMLPARDFVLANARLQRLPDPEAAADRALATVALTDVAARRIGTFSKGMRQRVKMATALVHDPQVLLLDEPFNGMDPRQRMHLMEIVRDLADGGRTVLFSSHILEEVEELADTVEVIVQGRHVASGDFRGLRRLLTERPHRYTVRCSDPRGLAARLVADPCVLGLSLPGPASPFAAPSPVGDLGLEVVDLDRFARLLPQVAVAAGVRLEEVRPDDDSLESVFTYLVARSGAGGGPAAAREVSQAPAHVAATRPADMTGALG